MYDPQMEELILRYGADMTLEGCLASELFLKGSDLEEPGSNDKEIVMRRDCNRIITYDLDAVIFYTKKYAFKYVKNRYGIFECIRDFDKSPERWLGTRDIAAYEYKEVFKTWRIEGFDIVIQRTAAERKKAERSLERGIPRPYAFFEERVPIVQLELIAANTKGNAIRSKLANMHLSELVELYPHTDTLKTVIAKEAIKLHRSIE